MLAIYDGYCATANVAQTTSTAGAVTPAVTTTANTNTGTGRTSPGATAGPGAATTSGSTSRRAYQSRARICPGAPSCGRSSRRRGSRSL